MKVTLLKKHEHAGRTHRPDDEIDVAKPTAQWLVDRKIARAGAAKTEAK